MHHFNINRIWNHFCLILLFLVISTLTITDVSLAGNYSDDWPTGGIVWDHTDVSGWAVTSNLSSVVVSGGGITYNHDKSCSWPMYDRSVNANAWVIHKNSDGRWHANTWDFMRKCQISKDSSHVGWGGGRPKAGQTYYFLVSGIARPGYGQTVQARSNIVKLVWGSSAVGTALSACRAAPSVTSFAATRTSVLSGESSKLSWNVTGASNLSLTATSNGYAQTTAIDSSLRSYSISPDATTVYTLNATNSCGKTTSDNSKVAVRKKGLPFLKVLLLYPGAPSVTTNEAQNVLEKSVTLTGTVDPNGDDATVTFEYGTTSAAYGPGVNGSPSVISKTGSSIYDLTGLSKGTTIYYRIVAQNDYGTSFGEEKEVTTDDEPVSVTKVATDPNPTTGTATGNGAVTANGSAITYAKCHVGITEGGPYPFSYPINESIPTAEDATSIPVTCSITNLSAGNTYYYILRSTNSVGTHDGKEKTIVLSSDS